MFRFRLSIVAHVASLAAFLPAQPYETPLLSLASGVFPQSQLYRLDVSGSVNTVVVFPFIFRPNSFTHHHDNRTLAVHSTNPDAVVLFDPATAAVVSVLHSGPPFQTIASVRPYHTGDYLVSDWGSSGTSVHLVRADGSGVRTVLRAPPFPHQIRAVAQDLITGEILAGLQKIGTAPGPSLIRISPATGAFTVLDPTARDISSLIQDHRDGTVVYGEYSGGIFRYAPNGGITTLISAGNRDGIAGQSLAFDRAEGNGILVAGGNRRIARIAFDPSGSARVVAVHSQNLPLLPAVAIDMAFEHGENVIPRRLGPGNRWSFELSFPREAGHHYGLLLSASGFTPGVVVGARTLPLVPDGLLFASVRGGLAPLLQNGFGVLDGAGRATATLDLSSLAASFSGVKLWLAVVTVAAPATIETISKPRIVILE